MNLLRSTLLLLAATALIIGTIGCKPKEVPYVVDEDEIERYLTETEDGQELFRVNGIISPDPYLLPNDGATYKDSALSHVRRVSVTLSDGLIDYGSLGYLREALAQVLDTFVVRTIRTKGSDIDTTENKRGFARYGYFLKLGGDNQAYVGWVLYGYNGFGSRSGDELNIRLSWPGVSMAGFDHRLYPDSLIDPVLVQLGQGYLKLSEFKTAAEGVSIAAEVTNRFRLILTSEGPGNTFVNSAMSPTATTNFFVDTLTAPSPASRLYNLIVLHMLKDSTGVTGRTGVFLPYRIP
ncbi:MAG: hypothetical protein NDJ18_10020 [candidate division Zixibacteria bacterium]|nr:hypothetical protein [candidate division Zixibacteria bacterium]